MYSRIVVAKKYFSEAWCNDVISFMDNVEPNPDLGKATYRKCTVRILGQEHKIFQNVFNDMIKFVKANAPRLNVDLDYRIDGNSMQYLTYNQGDFVSKHNDTRTVESATDFKTNRKLSMTIILSDPSEYQGGEFVFDPSVKIPFKVEGKGTTALFTSHSYHWVNPITSGTRKILFIFLTGPEWR